MPLNRSIVCWMLVAVAALGACAAPGSKPAAQAEVRHITPPNLDAAHLGERVLCYRPMRHGSPNMSVQQVGAQTIVHNYGHGGSGGSREPRLGGAGIALPGPHPWSRPHRDLRSLGRQGDGPG